MNEFDLPENDPTRFGMYDFAHENSVKILSPQEAQRVNFEDHERVVDDAGSQDLEHDGARAYEDIGGSTTDDIENSEGNADNRDGLESYN